MAYKIELLESKRIVKVIFKDAVGLDERLSAVHELCTQFNLFKPFRMIIDTRLATQKMTEHEQFIFGRYLAAREEFHQAFVAVLSVPEKCINKTIVKAANELNYQIRTFDDEQKAIRWVNQPQHYVDTICA